MYREVNASFFGVFVQCRSKDDPVMYLSSPDGVLRNIRRKVVDAITDINEQTYNEVQDSETLSRISQYEMAFRMQIHANEAFDIRQEPDYIHKLYGT